MRVLFIAACILVLAIAVWVRRVTFFSSFVDRQALSQDLILAAAYDYDYSLLSMQWPKSFCNTGQLECSQVPADFTIHGLWPQKNGRCRARRTSIYDDAMLKGNVSLTNTMNQTWPSLNARKRNEKFWGDEWEKHGTCTNLKQNDYFKRTCDRATWVRRRLLSSLGKKGIRQGTSHHKDVYNKAVESGLNLTPTFQCKRNASKVMLLLEIRFCVDKAGMQFINCSRGWIKRTQCDKVGKIAFP
ncbi:Intracellular ribonuclease LX [Morella rubra]|uniref:Intracellular ribonuclease LX n=1 Tax=Morella rubra TaxID=262757 RepID=A0A6A1UPS6_9ROSI|nr:Intracellular ribonuclease LX [Morella rubra]